MTGPPSKGIEVTRREQILEAAAGLFGGDDLANVTMDAVALRAGVAKGTLYNYFHSKEELYVAILTGRLDKLLDALRGSFAEEEDVQVRLRKYLVHTWNFLVKYPDFFRMVRKEESRPAVHVSAEVMGQRAVLRDLLRSILERGMGEGRIKQLPADLTADLVLGALEGAVFRALAHGATPQRNAGEPEVLYEFVWSGLAREQPAEDADLCGAGVLVTREEPPFGDLSREIARLGGRPVSIPLVRTMPSPEAEAVDEAVLRMATYDWIVFTSSRAVHAVAERVRALGAAPIAGSCRIAAVGHGTCLAAQSAFGRCDLVADDAGGVGLAQALTRAHAIEGKRVLFPRAEEARPDTARLLWEAGAVVDETIAYRTVPAPIDPEAVRARIEEAGVRVVTFASPSAVRAYVEGFGDRLPEAEANGSRRLRFAAIGATTAEALHQHGLPVDAIAAEPTFRALARAAARAAAGGTP